MRNAVLISNYIWRCAWITLHTFISNLNSPSILDCGKSLRFLLNCILILSTEEIIEKIEIEKFLMNRIDIWNRNALLITRNRKAKN